MPYIFVYGTLKNPRLFQTVTGMRYPEFQLGTARGIMYQYEGYPVSFKSEEGTIHGFVLEVPYEIIQILDAFEEEGRLFIREETTVTLETGKEITAFIYWGNPNHPGFSDLEEKYDRIPEGSWDVDEEVIDMLLDR